MNIKDKIDENIYKVVAINLSKFLNDKAMSLDELSSYADINKEILKEFISEKDGSISIYELYKISIILDISIEKFFEDRNS